MKFLKYFFLLLLILFVIGAIYLATLDGHYDVNRSRVIKAAPEVVFNEINDFKNWENWGPWYEMDSSIKETYQEKTSGEGAGYSWTGKDGGGSIHSIKVDKPNRIDQEIVFHSPFGDMKSDVYWLIEKVAEGTKLTWGMKGELGFLMRWMVKDMDNKTGPMYERGLELIDKEIQKKINTYSIETNGVVDYGGGYYLYTTTSSKIDEIGEKYPEMLLKVLGFVRNNKVQTTGGPFTLYHKYDEENGTAMFSVCYPIPEKIVPVGHTDILVGQILPGKYFKTTLKGSYEHSDEAWKTAIEKANEQDGYQMDENGEPFEKYINSPHKTPNPANLITEIYIPVKEIKGWPKEESVPMNEPER